MTDRKVYDVINHSTNRDGTFFVPTVMFKEIFSVHEKEKT